MSSSSSKQIFFIATLVILWYSSNIGVLLLNKLLLSNYGFKFPIFLTMCHMAACSILSYISIVVLKLVPFQKIKSRSQFLRIATLSIVFCGSVVGGNVSLRYLPVSFNQAVGATTPFFTAMFAYLMTFKREAWITYGALVPVVTGVVIASGGEPSFHLFGFIMCISATAARAFKSVLQGILLSSEGEKLNSMNLLLYMSPIAVAVLLPATLVMEPDVIDVTVSLALKHRFMWLLLLINSTMAYGANLTNFLVTKNTSALTLQVLGNAKGAVAVVISILLFRNPVTFIGIAGYSMTVMGVVAYGEAKRRYRQGRSQLRTSVGTGPQSVFKKNYQLAQPSPPNRSSTHSLTSISPSPLISPWQSSIDLSIAVNSHNLHHTVVHRHRSLHRRHHLGLQIAIWDSVYRQRFCSSPRVSRFQARISRFQLRVSFSATIHRSKRQLTSSNRSISAKGFVFHGHDWIKSRIIKGM